MEAGAAEYFVPFSPVPEWRPSYENGVATACDVDASTETESLGQAAAPTVADAIVAGNTPNVDAVSGSTVTSNAIMEAAKACYDAAGIAY